VVKAISMGPRWRSGQGRALAWTASPAGLKTAFGLGIGGAGEDDLVVESGGGEANVGIPVTGADANAAGAAPSALGRWWI